MNSKVFQSSNIHDGAFDTASGMMTITFNTGKVYEAKIPEPVWNGLCQAISPGQYFHSHIRPYYNLTPLKENDGTPSGRPVKGDLGGQK